MINNKLTVGITQGDGNGIGYEVIIKALADTGRLHPGNLWFFQDFRFLQETDTQPRTA